jgi:hypothetical protein
VEVARARWRPRGAVQDGAINVDIRPPGDLTPEQIRWVAEVAVPELRWEWNEYARGRERLEPRIPKPESDEQAKFKRRR